MIAAVIELVDAPALRRLYRIYGGPHVGELALAQRPDFSPPWRRCSALSGRAPNANLRSRSARHSPRPQSRDAVETAPPSPAHERPEIVCPGLLHAHLFHRGGGVGRVGNRQAGHVLGCEGEGDPEHRE